MTAAASHPSPGRPPAGADHHGPIPSCRKSSVAATGAEPGPPGQAASSTTPLPTEVLQLSSTISSADDLVNPAAAAAHSGAVPAASETNAASDPSGKADNPTGRRHTRQRLDVDPPARIALANHQPVFVTLSDISQGGCCIVRKGRLDLSNGDAVSVDLWTDDIEAKLSIHARVCWCSHEEATSRAGLRFVETNHRLLRQIEAYVQHFHQPRDESRPQARQPGQAVMPPAPPPPPPPPQQQRRIAPLPPSPERASRGAHGTALPGESRPLASMPRPARLTSFDLQRRMRPAHRQELARIAEETGIHIHTLYGWLRTLRLEGEINRERPGDPEAWSASDKVSTLLQVAGMDVSERVAYCSRLGLSEMQLQRWHEAALQANEKPLLILRAEAELQRQRVRDQREIRQLQKQLRRRERDALISEELLQVVRKLQSLGEQDERR